MLVKVRVIPKASRNLVKEEGGRLKVYLTQAPEKNKANKALVELLASYYKVKKNRIRIVKGEHSQNKLAEIETALF